MNSACQLLAVFSFGSGWMLLWGCAAAIPIVIHFWNRRQQQEVTWAAMEFLLAAVRKHTRRIRLEQLLLLALRTLILVLLAIALADPLLSTLPKAGGTTAAGGRTHTVIVLDGSYSMAARSDAASNFARARELAAQIVQGATQGDGFSLLVMSDPPRAVIRDVAFDPETVADELGSVELQHTGAELADTLDEVDRIVRAAGQQHPGLDEHQVYVLTDLGLSTWEAVRSAPIREHLARLSQRATLLVHEVGPRPSRNLAVTRLSSDEPVWMIGSSRDLEVEVRNFGPQPESCRVELLANQRSVGEAELEVPAGGTALCRFSHRFELAGEQVLEARLGEDPVATDNRRWLSVPVREALRVLCVEGKQGAAEFLALALAPQTAPPGNVRPEVAGENALLERDVFEYDCVFLCNIGRFGRQEAEILYRYVQQGGGLVTILGDQVQADSYNEALAGERGGRRVLPARLGSVLGQAVYHFEPQQYQHPIVAPFRGHERSGLLTTPIWRYVQLSPSSADARVALAFDSGDAALVTESLGQGRSILLATAASPASVDASTTPPTPWTALATGHSFPPLMHEILRYAVAGSGDSRNVLVGQPLTARLPRGAAGVTVALPGGSPEQAAVSFDGGVAVWMYPDTHVSGEYRAQAVGEDLPADVFAVNVDTRESDLERLDVELLPSQFTDARTLVSAPTTTVEAGSRFPLFRALLSAVLLLLVCESSLCWFLGRRIS